MIRRSLLLAALLAVFFGQTPPARADNPPPARWVVVTAPAFREAIEPLCRQRKADGLDVVVVQTTDVLTAKEVLAGDAGPLEAHIHKLCRDSKGTSYVLLVGATEAGKLEEAEKKVLPPLRGTVNRMKGQPSDNGYGCLGDDLLPTVAVGRFPVRTEAECKQLVQKTLAFERESKPGAWRRRVTLLVGHPGGDSELEKATGERWTESTCLSLADRVHPGWTVRTVMHCRQSRFCVPDDRLREQALLYLKEGQAFTVYAGHSWAGGLWSEGARFLDRADWGKLSMAGGQGVLVSCGCFGCQLYGADGEGYGLAALRNPDGPVAVVGAHGESYAAMGQLAFNGLLKSFATADPPARLGECFLGVKEGIARGKMDLLTFNLLDYADGSKGKTPLAVQRKEHLQMWLLLGDPALRLPALPSDLKLKLDGDAEAGKTVVVRGEAPASLEGAKVRVTAERVLSSKPADLQPLPAAGAERAAVMLANHERANRFELAAAEATVKGGRFEAAVTLPAKLPGPRLILRAYAAADKREAQGVLSVPLNKE
jgi:hypothetical protein